MATSGTVDTTVIATDVVLAHAMRRCGVAASGQTPEILELAQESLYFLMLSLASRGLNLWCVDKQILDVTVGKKTYVLPPGTLDVLNVAFSTATYVTGTNSSAATYYKTALSTATPVVRIGLTVSVLPTSSVLLQFSDDGSSWTTSTTVATTSITAGTRQWFDMNITGNHLYYRAFVASGSLSVTEFLLVNTISDLPVKAMNRDDYTALPIKDNPGSPAVNYFFEKLIDPQMTVWPVPNVSGNQICVWRHRQIQDVGTLTQEIEIPNRWFEEVIWQIAARLCFELPAGVVDPARMAAVLTMADKQLIEVESGETDHAPTYYAPAIRGYTA